MFTKSSLVGALDADLQKVCEREKRILVTLDTDFADTRRYDPGDSPASSFSDLPTNRSGRASSASMGRFERWPLSELPKVSGLLNRSESAFVTTARVVREQRSRGDRKSVEHVARLRCV